MSKSIKEKIYFYEVMGVLNLISSLIYRRSVFYNRHSFLLRLIVQMFSIPMPSRVKTIWFGDLKSATGFRRRAYEEALSKVKHVKFKSISVNLKGTLDINYELIMEKLLLDSLYKESEFSSFTQQYAVENPNVDIIQSKWSEVIFKNNRIMYGFKSFIVNNFQFLLGVLAVPFFSIYFCVKNSVADTSGRLPIKNSIICEVESHKTFEMFSNIFEEREQVMYFIQNCYLNNFKDDILNLNIIPHFLSKSDKWLLKCIAIRFIAAAFFNYKELSRLGILYFHLYKIIANGILITPQCENCAYLTFEHMSTIKAVRNEILRESNNISIFVPYNSYAVDHYFSPEYRYNYDVLCSPCELLEKVYRMQNATTSIYLHTGSYAYHHLSGSEDVGLVDRLKELEEFKGCNVIITVLSSGIFDEIISGEARLMGLANKLSSIDGIKVIIRPKPGVAVKKYEGFFDEYFRNNESVLLTDGHYNLFDFLHVTDLFITGLSSSAVDLCNAGGEFFSIDFWIDEDMYLWQTAIDGVYLKENEAFDTIKAWINNDPPDQRELHSKRMIQLRKLTRYKFDDFESYKSNLLSLLNPYLPNVPTI